MGRGVTRGATRLRRRVWGATKIRKKGKKKRERKKGKEKKVNEKERKIQVSVVTPL